MRDCDKELLEHYTQTIYGCSFDDLSEKEEKMLIAHVRDREPDFENCRGIA